MCVCGGGGGGGVEPGNKATSTTDPLLLTNCKKSRVLGSELSLYKFLEIATTDQISKGENGHGSREKGDKNKA